jgi:hypothetical protein
VTLCCGPKKNRYNYESGTVRAPPVILRIGVWLSLTCRHPLEAHLLPAVS